jgi:hypothetical protein
MEMTNAQPWPSAEREKARENANRLLELRRTVYPTIGDVEEWTRLLKHAPADLAAALDEIERLQAVVQHVRELQGVVQKGSYVEIRLGAILAAAVAEEPEDGDD